MNKFKNVLDFFRRLIDLLIGGYKVEPQNEDNETNYNFSRREKRLMYRLKYDGRRRYTKAPAINI